MQDNTVFDETQSWQVQPHMPASEHPLLIVLEGGDVKTRHMIDAGEMTLGRDLACEIILTDTKSSRRHAKLVYHNFGAHELTPEISIEDLGSTNGTYVNGRRIKRVELKDRDKLTIGSTLFGYFLRDEKSIQADETLIRLASYDSLTGLHNRGVFNVEIRREFDRARRYGRAISLLMLDIDHFKRFNDSYGHQAGDQVLREIGGLLSMNCRSNDLPARYGGEEFAIILPETPMESAIIKAERIRKTVMNHPFTSESTSLCVTISLGLADQQEWMKQPEDLIEAADKALYKAKHSGRNQVCWYRAGAAIDFLESA